MDFWSFFALFVPSLVNWLIPAFIMMMAVPNERPQGGGEMVEMKRGAKRVIVLFLLTITTAVSFHNFLHLPPVIGMLTGLAYLQFFGYFLKKTYHREFTYDSRLQAETEVDHTGQIGDPVASMFSRRLPGPSGTPCCSSTVSCSVSAVLVSSATFRWPPR